MIKKTINIGPILDFKKWMVRCIWVETVFSEIDNFCAISLLDNPLLHLIKNILRRASEVLPIMREFVVLSCHVKDFLLFVVLLLLLSLPLFDRYNS